MLMQYMGTMIRLEVNDGLNTNEIRWAIVGWCGPGRWLYWAEWREGKVDGDWTATSFATFIYTSISPPWRREL